MTSMNIYGIVILLTLILEYGLNLFADFLNLRTLHTEVPEEMASVYDHEAYRKSQDYTRSTTKLGQLTSTFSLLLTLLFWFSGGFNFLDVFVQKWGFNAILSGLYYIGILSFARGLLSLPFSLYSTFVIEARFGFNKTTPGLFFLDWVKGTVLSIVLGGPLLAALLAFFEWAGPLAWLYAWALVVIFLLFIQFIAPTWIMPIFNKFKPLEDGELKEKIMALARSVHFPLQNVFVMDGSKRTSKSNAFFTGFGKNKRIALFDTLIDSQTVPELVAVLAHEIGHYKKKHIVQGLILSILHTGVMFFLLSVFISHRGLYDAFYMTEPSIYTGMLFFGMLFTPLDFVLSLFLNILSRKNEYEADRFAVASVEHPESMIDALKKLSIHNLSNLTPHPFYSFLHDSHPPLLKRIRAIRAL
ncbi:M48 family metallopeptidase [Nitrospira defluvii]|nr:M48 family metallopeptidase [Nitrospira defluvii]